MEPNGIIAHDKLLQANLLRGLQGMHPHCRRTQRENLIQEHLLDGNQILRALIAEMTAILLLRANRIQHEFMLGKTLDQHLHPGGYTANNVGIGPLRQ